jgi:hypothetical protein
MCSWTTLLGAAVLVPALAWGEEVTFTPRQRNWDERSNKGECTIRVWVDDEAEVDLRGREVRIRTLTGQPARDDGSECTQPLPANVTRFEFRGIDGRGEVRLVQEPDARNNWTAVVNIRDRKGGGEGYTYRLRWETGGRPPVGGVTGESFNFYPRGNGTVRRGTREDRIDSMDIDLRADGTAIVRSLGSATVRFEGRWRGQGDIIDLDLEYDGTGRIYLRDRLRRPTVQRVEISSRRDRTELFFQEGSGGSTPSSGWWSGNNSNTSNRPLGTVFNLSQSGRGSLDWDNRNWRLTQVAIEARSNRDIRVRLHPSLGREFEFRGELVQEYGNTIEIDVFESSEGRAKARLTAVRMGTSSLDSLTMTGELNGRTIRADFRR